MNPALMLLPLWLLAKRQVTEAWSPTPTIGINRHDGKPVLELGKPKSRNPFDTMGDRIAELVDLQQTATLLKMVDLQDHPIRKEFELKEKIFRDAGQTEHADTLKGLLKRLDVAEGKA